MRNMSKKRIILAIVVGGLSVLIALNFNTIKFTYSMLSIYMKSRNVESNVSSKDIGPDTNINERPSLDNPIQMIIDEEKTKEEKDKLDIGDVDNTEPNDNVVVEEEFIENKPDPNSYLAILSTYNSQLEQLQNTFLNRLDGLVTQGIYEYNEGNSGSSMALDYLDRGAYLERECDKEFNTMINSMKKELTSHGYNTDIVSQIEGYYKDLKIEKKEILIDKAMSYLEE